MILYLTFNGLLEPLGRSQILKPLSKLARRGFDVALITLEKRRDLENRAAVEQVTEQTRVAGIQWRFLPYSERAGARAVLDNLNSLRRLGCSVAERGGVSLVHARSYPPAVVGAYLAKRYSARLLFDIRGYWIDERREEGRWFRRDMTYLVAKRLERSLFSRSDGVVALTETSAGDLRSGRIASLRPGVRVEVIPTIADFSEFLVEDRPSSPAVQMAGGRRIVCFSGAVRAACDIDGLVQFLRELYSQEEVFFLALTRQGDEMNRALDRAGVPVALRHVVSVPHAEMGRWLSGAHFGVLFLRTTFAIRAMMPTKLAEFVGAGVIPVQHGGSAEIGEMVAKLGGISLPSLAPATLRTAVRDLLITDTSAAARNERSMRAREHFDLDCGVEKYAAFWSELGETIT